MLMVNESDKDHMKLFILVNPENLKGNLFNKFITSILNIKRNENHHLILVINKNNKKTNINEILNYYQDFNEIFELENKSSEKINKIKKEIQNYSKSKYYLF